MATATPTMSRFHNLSPAQLADEIGRVDAILKAAEAEAKALKAEMIARAAIASPGVAHTTMGDSYTVTVSEQIAGRLDTKLLREVLGNAISRYEVATVSTVVRIKPTARTLAVAMAAA